MADYIRTGDFCHVTSDKFERYGVKRNHIVYVAGHKALPIAENDPYTQRIKFFVHLVDHDGHTQTDKMYLMDPDSLSKVKSGKQKKLTQLLRVDIEPDSIN